MLRSGRLSSGEVLGCFDSLKLVLLNKYTTKIVYMSNKLYAIIEKSERLALLIDFKKLFF